MKNYTHFISIKRWAEEDRPREKLLQKGKRALSNAELMAILLGTGNRNETAVDLAKRVRRDRFDPRTIRGFAAAFAKLVSAIVSEPEQPAITAITSIVSRNWANEHFVGLAFGIIFVF